MLSCSVRGILSFFFFFFQTPSLKRKLFPSAAIFDILERIDQLLREIILIYLFLSELWGSTLVGFQFFQLGMQNYLYA